MMQIFSNFAQKETNPECKLDAFLDAKLDFHQVIIVADCSIGNLVNKARIMETQMHFNLPLFTSIVFHKVFHFLRIKGILFKTWRFHLLFPMQYFNNNVH